MRRDEDAKFEVRLWRKGQIFVFKKRSFLEKASVVLSLFVTAEATDMDDAASEAGGKVKKGAQN